MKLLLLIIFLTSGICSAALAQTNDYTPFKKETNGIVYYSAWLEVVNAHLDVKIPSAKIKQRWGYESADVSLRDFTLRVVPSINNNLSIILLSASYGAGKTYRATVTDEQALDDWVKNVLLFGYGYDDLLTDEQARALMQGE